MPRTKVRWPWRRNAIRSGEKERRRRFVDAFTGRLIALGGGAIISAITLIFLFLIWVVLPIFTPVGIERLTSTNLHNVHPVAVLADDAFEAASLITQSGELIELDLTGPGTTVRHALTRSGIKAAKPLYPLQDTFALLTDKDGLRFYRIAHKPRPLDRMGLAVRGYEALFDGNEVALTDHLDSAITTFDVFRDGERLLIAALGQDGTTVLLQYPNISDFLPLDPPQTYRLEQPPGSPNGVAPSKGAPGFVNSKEQTAGKPAKTAAHIAATAAPQISQIYIGPGGRWLYHFSDSGDYRLTDINRPGQPVAHGAGRLLPQGTGPTALAMLVGRYSVLVADDRGAVTQWSLRRSGSLQGLTPVRTFHYDSPIIQITAEPRRKGFVAVARDNAVHLGHTTSHRTLASFNLGIGTAPPLAAFTADADGLLLVGAGRLDAYAINNNHPEISWSALWQKVWYEGYDEPVHKWQSSSADTDFEPKFSLTPLLFGILKAAFYAMLFAIPLAVMGAVYTACFMSGTLRAWIKPGIEMMAGLPTVVLGFLAGIWLAPLVENKLAAVFFSALALPLGVLLLGISWTLLPSRVAALCEGWLALLTVPLLGLIGAVVFSFDGVFEAWLFDGDTRGWLQRHLGLEYDQRNALVVGMAMGVATVPIIFSVAEQALHGVPAHLAQGSLALGATRWQTVGRIVLPTASAGIAAAILIGIGRALGETMIVLMASGNTPILDMNLFQGLRALTANIAVELPEAQVGSTHYRILFLIALLLFVMTFLFNTAAELVRERLRIHYARL